MHHLAFRSILAGTLFVAAISAIATAAQTAGNLLSNAGFETPQADAANAAAKPDNWDVFCREPNGAKISLSTGAAKTGKQSLRFTCTGVAESYEGIAQVVNVSEGKRFELSVFVGNDNAQRLKGTTRGQISIEWKDSTGNEIARSWGPDWGALAGDSWTQFKMTGEAPAKAVQAVAVITVHEGKEPGGGSFYADDMSLTETGNAK